MALSTFHFGMNTTVQEHVLSIEIGFRTYDKYPSSESTMRCQLLNFQDNFLNSDIRGNATSEITSPQKNYRLTLQVDITGTGNFTAQLVRRDSDRVIGTI